MPDNYKHIHGQKTNVCVEQCSKCSFQLYAICTANKLVGLDVYTVYICASKNENSYTIYWVMVTVFSHELISKYIIIHMVKQADCMMEVHVQ